MRAHGLLAAAFVLLLAPGAQARLAVAGLDGKQLEKGEDKGQTPDSIAVIDLAAATPKVIGTLPVPAAMIGPPEAVVVSPDERFAIVTASQKSDPADPYHPVPDGPVSVIGLDDPAHPRLLQTIQAGPGASGISINRAGNLVLVASRNADAVYAFTLKNRHLAAAGKVDLGAGADPTDVVIAPDDTHAYAITWGAGKVIEIAIDGSKLSLTGKDVPTGRNAYGGFITPDGNWLVNTNVGGSLNGDKTGALTMVDLKAHTLALSLPVGNTPEHIALSPDGKHALLVLANGAPRVKSSPKWDSVTGVLKIFAIGPGTLTPVAEAPSCHWLQGAAFSDDGRTVLAECAGERTIEVYHFDGKALVQDKAATLPFVSRPGAIATHRSR